MNNTSVTKQQSFIEEKMENDLSTDLCDAIEKNDLNTSIDLISKGANVNVYDKNNKLPLQIAIKNESTEIIEELIQKGANINAVVHDKEKDKTLLQFAMEESNADIVLLLVKKGANTVLDNNNIETVLHYAAKNDLLELVKCMIDKGINVDIKTNEDYTPLHVAAKHGRFEIIKYLCDMGADVNARTSRGSTPLHFAIHNTMVAPKIVKFLIDNGAEIDIENNFKYTPLQLSLHDKNFVVARVLLEKGADINKLYNNTHYARCLHGTLLHWAARNYDGDEIIKFLVENGADINATEGDGRTPLCLYVKHAGTPEMVKFFVEHGADLNNRSGGSPLYWAFYMRNKALEILLIELGLDVNAPIDSHNDLKAPLHIVPDLPAMKLLIDKGANVNIIDKYGNTPLHYASHLSLVKCLVENGAAVNARNHEGNTPLHTAYTFPVVEYLVEKGADIDATNREGYTPLHFAKNLFIAEHLIELGADVKAVTRDGKTVLHSIAEADVFFDSRYRDLPDLVDFFIDKGINVNTTDKNGNTPLHICAAKGNIYTEKRLLERGADISALNNEGIKPTDSNYGCCASMASAIEKLVTVMGEGPSFKDIELLFFNKLHSCNITLDSRKTTILHLMVQKCNASIIETFFKKLQHRQYKPNVTSTNNFVDACDVDHWMPLHYAAQRGDCDIVKHLLKNGAMYNAETGNCETPLQLTTDGRTESILKLTEQMFKEVKLGNYAEFVNCIDKKYENFNPRDKDGNSLLHLAIYHGCTDIKLLLSYGTNFTQSNKEGKTVLHFASAKASKNIAEILLNYVQFKRKDKINEFVNLQAMDGSTALHIAAKQNCIELVKLLLSFGAIYNIKNKEGKVPVDLSTDADVIALLGFIQELFNDAKYGKTEIIDKLQNLDCNQFKMVTSTCTRQRFTLKDILKMNEYESILEEFSKIESTKKFVISGDANKKWVKKESSEESEEDDLGFGLFD